MARLARVIVAGIPHHVTKRGNRRMIAFMEIAEDWGFLAGAEAEEQTNDMGR